MKWIFFILALFFFVGALVIVSNENLHLSKRAEFAEFYALYYQWIIKSFSNAQGITAAVIKLDWLPPLENKSLNSTLKK